MSDAVQEELRGFVAELIEQSGGLVDWPAGSDRVHWIPQMSRAISPA